MTTSPFTLASRQSLFWRIHFWAALLASPFALVAALTGILYIFTPQIEHALYAHLDEVAPVVGPRRPLDDLVAAAQAAAPAGMALKSVVTPAEPGESVRVYFGPARKDAAPPAAEHAGHNHAGGQPGAAAGQTAARSERMTEVVIVYLNPYTAEVLGSHAETDRFNVWARRLHSSLLQGDGWRWLIELSASWLMVMLFTGIYLWWPRGAATALPQRESRGRIAWKQWHGFMGVALSLMSLLILTTGLTWSRYAGDQIRSLRDAIRQAPPSAPKGLRSAAADGRGALTWQAAWEAARGQAPRISLQISPPLGPGGTWRVSNFDRGQPTKRFNLVLDAYSGKTLFYAGWDRQTVFSKATAIGIPFHRGEFGWWNQALLLVFGLGVLFSLLSGWVMFFKRRRRGVAGLPRLLPGAWTAVPLGGWAAAGVMFALLPLLAASAALVALFELLLTWRQRRSEAPSHC